MYLRNPRSQPWKVEQGSSANTQGETAQRILTVGRQGPIIPGLMVFPTGFIVMLSEALRGFEVEDPGASSAGLWKG